MFCVLHRVCFHPAKCEHKSIITHFTLLTLALSGSVLRRLRRFAVVIVADDKASDKAIVAGDKAVIGITFVPR